MFYAKVYGWLLIVGLCGALQAADKPVVAALEVGQVPVEVPQNLIPSKYDCIDMREDGQDGEIVRTDILSQRSFSELYQEQKALGRPLIIARVLLGDRPMYYEAHGVNRKLFGLYPFHDDYLRDLITYVGTHFGTLREPHSYNVEDHDFEHMAMAVDPSNRQPWEVDKIHYFMRKPNGKTFVFLCSLQELISQTEKGSLLRKQFQDNAFDVSSVGEILYWGSLRYALPMHALAQKSFEILDTPGIDETVRKQARWYTKWSRYFGTAALEKEDDCMAKFAEAFEKACRDDEPAKKIVGNLHAGFLYSQYTGVPEQNNPALYIKIAQEQSVDGNAKSVAQRQGKLKFPEQFDQDLQKASLWFKAKLYSQAIPVFEKILRIAEVSEACAGMIAAQLFAHSVLGYLAYHGLGMAVDHVRADRHFTRVVQLLFIGADDEQVQRTLGTWYQTGQALGGTCLAFPVDYQLAQQHLERAPGSCSNYVRARAKMSHGCSTLKEYLMHAYHKVKQVCWSTPTRRVCTSLAVTLTLGVLGKRYVKYKGYFTAIR